MNQTFPVFYGDKKYMIDPSKLFNASRRFAQIVQPFGSSANRAQLHILYDKFEHRNIENFLKIAQGIQSDVQNSEMKEICEIARMFQADQIYNTGQIFIQKNIDPNFFIPDTKYSDDEQYMMIELPIAQTDVQFDEEEEVNRKIPKKYSTIIYEIRTDNRKMKCSQYKMIRDNVTLFSAKKKGLEVFVGKGDEIHIKKSKENHCAKIVQEQNSNTIIAEGQQIKLNYVRFRESKYTSMNVSFNHNGNTLCWNGKEPKLCTQTGKYSLNLKGSHNHKPVASNKNSAMVNSQGKIMFITRKMGGNFYEVECLPNLSPLIAFCFALSSIIGPTTEFSPDNV